MSSIHYYYHLGLDTSMDLKKIFQDTKLVVMQGSVDRATRLATALAEGISKKLSKEVKPELIGKTERFTIYKINHVISVSHGMGIPSMSILLNELAQVMELVGIKDTVRWIRLGTSGGIGVEPGSMILTTGSVNGELVPVYKTYILGKEIEYPSVANKEFVEELIKFGKDNNFNFVSGITMSCHGFYEEQARTDGFFHDISEEERLSFLKKCDEKGVRNIEMEALYLQAFCHKAGIKCGIVCTALVNRLNGDQVTAAPEELKKWNDNNARFIISYSMSLL